MSELDELKERARESVAAAKASRGRAQRLVLGLLTERAESRPRSARVASLSAGQRKRVSDALRIIGTRRGGGKRHGRKVSLTSDGLRFKFQFNADSGTWKELKS